MTAFSYTSLVTMDPCYLYGYKATSYSASKLPVKVNHLGNVQVVVSDRRISVCDGSLNIERFLADVVSATDYYPFGMAMPDRQWYVNSDSSGYRFKFNGKESDNEINGIGNIYDYGFRIYDPRLGRFLSVDPLIESYPWYTPYQFAGNTPIWASDLDGLEEAFATDYYDEEKGVYMRKIELNPNATEADKGKIQFKYSDGSTSGIIPAAEEDLARIEHLRKSKEEQEKARAQGKIIGVATGIHYKIDGPTSEEKPVVKKAEPTPSSGPSSPKPKPTPDSKPKPKPIVDPPHIAEPVNFSNLKFYGGTTNLINYGIDANRILQPVLQRLLKDPGATVHIQLYTDLSKNDESLKLLNDRAQLLRDWFTSRGVKPGQVKIVILDSSFNGTGNTAKGEIRK